MKPGVYADLSNTDYHQETEWVSASMLKTYLPEQYKRFTGDSSALDFGTAFHTTVLGEGDLIRPVTAASWVGKEAKAERADAYANGETPILVKDLARVDAMQKAVADHAEARALLFETPGRAELSVFAEVDGVPSKCRFDWLTDTGIGVDLKSTSTKPGEHSLSRAVLDFGYEVQTAHYMAVAAAAGIELESFTFVFCQKDEPHAVTVATLDDAFMERGRQLRDLALSRLLHPEFTDAYPGATGSVKLSCPRWATL